MQKRLFTVDEYYKMGELGFFEEQRTELIEGEIIIEESITPPEAVGIRLVSDVLRKLFDSGYVNSTRLPLRLSNFSEPDPKVFITKGEIRDFAKAHPTTAEIIVEVAQNNLDYFQKRKASLYGKYSIQDYWILNLKNKRLEVYRCPITDEMADYSFAYADISIFTKSDEISPLAKPAAKIKVADLLP
jgi:hypothetical protein